VRHHAAAAQVAAGRADHLRDAVPLAAKAIDSGAAASKLAALVDFSFQSEEGLR
jgi:anthranilate phosphoribosyltransferase